MSAGGGVTSGGASNCRSAGTGNGGGSSSHCRVLSGLQRLGVLNLLGVVRKSSPTFPPAMASASLLLRIGESVLYPVPVTTFSIASPASLPTRAPPNAPSPPARYPPSTAPAPCVVNLAIVRPSPLVCPTLRWSVSPITRLASDQKLKFSVVLGYFAGNSSPMVCRMASAAVPCAAAMD